MQNGLLETAPFMTIRVSPKKSSYPTPVDFVDINEDNLDEILSFAHGECGSDLTIKSVKTGDPETSHFLIRCEECNSEVKMYRNVFWGEVSILSVYHERWIAGAYQFVQAWLP